MTYQNADPIIYVGTDYTTITGKKGTIIKIQLDGTYGIRIEATKHQAAQQLWGVPEEDLEPVPEYVYRWRTENYIHHKVYYSKGPASAQAKINSHGGRAWVQRAKVEWEDV